MSFFTIAYALHTCSTTPPLQAYARQSLVLECRTMGTTLEPTGRRVGLRTRAPLYHTALRWAGAPTRCSNYEPHRPGPLHHPHGSMPLQEVVGVIPTDNEMSPATPTWPASSTLSAATSSTGATSAATNTTTATTNKQILRACSSD